MSDLVRNSKNRFSRVSAQNNRLALDKSNRNNIPTFFNKIIKIFCVFCVTKAFLLERGGVYAKYNAYKEMQKITS